MGVQLTVKYDGAESTVNIDTLTFAEARAIEKVSGVRFVEMKNDAELFANMDMMQAMVWVAIKRVRPGFRYSDLDDVPMTDVDISTHDDGDDEAEGDDAANPQDSASLTAED